MTKPTILVTAARGKTGSYVVKQLIEQDLPVRAFVHRRDDKAEQLAVLGAEVVAGDLFDLNSLRSALKGVKRAYFCGPPIDRLLEATMNFAVAGREAGLEAVVNMSQFIAREGHPSPLTRQHWLAERVLDWAGLDAIHIRPTFFAEMFWMLNGKNIAAEGKIYLPFGQEKHAPVTTEDVARVVVGLLTNPEPHLGRVYQVTGDQDLSLTEIAAIFSKILEKPIEYLDIPLEPWQKGLAEVGLSPFVIEHLSRASEEHRQGRFAGVTDVVQKVGGRSPQSLDSFIRLNAQAFGT